ncbi:glycine/sarcosine/betaine reductase complex component C subunit beta [Dehalococcoidia bacterium]|nr:glycine/sarcosine/betaine reductase complex component C subunit beta [Dehalococcoidia bacterium]
MPWPSNNPVIRGTRYVLVHAPDLVRYGSKPSREISKDPGLEKTIGAHLRSYEEALAYGPSQVYIGGMYPDDLKQIPQPWYEHSLEGFSRWGSHGEIMPEDEFYGVLKIVDGFDLVWLEEGFVREVHQKLSSHPLISNEDLEKLDGGKAFDKIEEQISVSGSAIPLYLNGDRLVGCFHRGHEEDLTLTPERLLENLTCKATAMLALRSLHKFSNVSAESIDFILGCGEEAIGDRYNPGGGNLAKAVGEICGCVMASGADIKDFCCAPVQALAIAGGLVAARAQQNIAVIAGCSLAKLGMKYQGHLRNDMPILEDVLAGFATLVTENDGRSPVLRLDTIGRHNIGAGSSQQNIVEKLVSEPLKRIGWSLGDVNKYATELHNPEVTEPSGSGNVPQTNYRMIAALAALQGEITRSDIPDFVETHGMPGFSPTQGHIASAIPFLAHAEKKMSKKELQNALFLAKGSLFLGRMTHLADGVSFVLERNEE